MLLNSPLVITLRVAWSACKARRKLGRTGTDFDTSVTASDDGTPAAVCNAAADIEMSDWTAPAHAMTARAASASTGTALPSSLVLPPSPEHARRQSSVLHSDETGHLRRAANQIAMLLESGAENDPLFARELLQILRDVESRNELARFLGVCIELDVARVIAAVAESGT